MDIEQIYNEIKILVDSCCSSDQMKYAPHVFASISLSRFEEILKVPGRMIVWSNHPEFSGMSNKQLNLIRKNVQVNQTYCLYDFNDEVHQWCSEFGYSYSCIQFIFPCLAHGSRIDFAVIEFKNDKALLHFKLRWL